MQQTRRLAIEGPTTKKLVEEVQQAATQSVTKVAVIQVELGDIHSKIVVPAQ